MNLKLSIAAAVYGFLMPQLGAQPALPPPTSDPFAGVIPALSAPTAPEAAPHIQFDNAVWDFGKIQAGELMKHNFIFTNTGTAALEITQVQPGCGCTTAGEWTRRVEPGGTGSISLQFNSANFNGPVFKSAVVHSNDKQQPNVALQIKGTVWKALEINPQFVMLNVPPDAPSASNVVQITYNGEDVLTLDDPASSNPMFSARLITNAAGKSYQVVIIAAPGAMTNSVTQGQITLKTSLSATPLITLTAWANVQPAILVVPPQVVLPPGPLAQAATPEITIQNNSSNQVRVSDVSVNLPGVSASVMEKIPGRNFAVKLSFPAGYEVPAGVQGMLTAKSTSLQMPSIKVPVMQSHRPVVSVLPPPPPGNSQ